MSSTPLEHVDARRRWRVCASTLFAQVFLLLASLAAPPTRPRCPRRTGRSWPRRACENADNLSLRFQSLPEKNDLGSFPTKRSIERLRIAPNVGDQNSLTSITKGFFDCPNQAGCDALMLDARKPRSWAQTKPRIRELSSQTKAGSPADRTAS